MIAHNGKYGQSFSAPVEHLAFDDLGGILCSFSADPDAAASAFGGWLLAPPGPNRCTLYRVTNQGLVHGHTRGGTEY